MPAQEPINSDDAEVQGAVAVKYGSVANRQLRWAVYLWRKNEWKVIESRLEELD